MFGRALILKVAAFKPVESLVRRSFLFRPLVRRFIAGDDLANAMDAAQQLASRKLFSTLDYLGENTSSESEALAAVKMYKQMVETISASPDAPSINISIKLTQCGLDQGEDFAEKNLRELLTFAGERNMFVRVDMESTAYTERTIAMIERVFPDHNNVGTVLQSYLRRTPDDLERLLKVGCRVRMVKGAYLEPADLAFPEKSDVDRAYVEQSKRLMAEGNYPAIATHDEKIIAELKAYAESAGIAKDRFEWQMLYGIRRDLQDSLRAEGYPVRVYVPYGDRWYPYFTRRLAERPANSLFILKSLFKR